MNTIKSVFYVVLLFCFTQNTFSQYPIRPLAQDYVLIAKSEDPKNQPLYSPSILRLSSGRLVISYTQAQKKESVEADCQVFLTSDDGGKTWIKRGENTEALQGRIFEANGILYYIATGAGLPICKSTDNGNTWSSHNYLTSKSKTWQQTAANVWYANGNVYLEMEWRARVINAWGAGEKAVVVLKGKITDDLTQASNWTFSSPLNYGDIIPCYRENKPKIEYFGIPFYEQAYPDRNLIAPGRSFSPMGWAEGNIIQILDPNHYWYDDSGNTFHVFMRTLTGMTNYGAVCKVVENENGTMTTMLETAPSGKKILYLPMPGGHNRFHLLYDTQTKTYWLLSNQTTDSMTKAEFLASDRHDLGYGERNRLVLHFSKNMVDWCFAGLVAIGETQKEARSYAAMDFDGEDIVILSRSGDPDSHTAHETNMITFHRVKNFRELIY